MTKPNVTSNYLDDMLKQAFYCGTHRPDTMEEAQLWLGAMCKDVCYLVNKLRMERHSHNTIWDNINEHTNKVVNENCELKTKLAIVEAWLETKSN